MEPTLEMLVQLGGFAGLLVYIIFQDWKAGKFNGHSVDKKMDKLLLHFNHETTDLLQKIEGNTAQTNRKLEEFDRFGIPCRDKKP